MAAGLLVICVLAADWLECVVLGGDSPDDAGIVNAWLVAAVMLFGDWLVCLIALLCESAVEDNDAGLV